MSHSTGTCSYVAPQLSSPHSPVTIKADTGATHHYFRTADKHLLQNISPTVSSKSVRLPNNTIIRATEQGRLPIHSSLNLNTETVQILPKLTNTSLLSIGQLCDQGCLAVFHKKFLKFFKDNNVILEGIRNKVDGLWDIHFTTSKAVQNTSNQPQLNIIISKNKNKYQLANFYHAALCSPTLSTLRHAIQNDHLLSWPAIHDLTFSTTFVNTTATALGHLDQTRKNLQSTKETITPRPQENLSQFPTSTNKTYSTISSIIPFTSKEMTYGDLTGSFPYTSSRGAKYLYLLYDYDANAILVHTLKTRQAQEIKKAWESLTARLMKHGHVIKYFILDNECSQDLRQAIRKKIWTFNWCHRTFTDAMRLNVLFGLLKPTFFQPWPHVTQIIPSPNGIDSWFKVNLHSTS